MLIKTFKVEQWMNEFENDAVYNLAETCVDSLTLRELLLLANEDPEKYMASLVDTRLSYSHIHGSPELLQGMSSMYKNIQPSQIVPTHGAIGANYSAIITILDPEDQMISVMPTYQQHYSIPESIGADVHILKLKKENNFLPDLDELKQLVNKNTKMISLNNPNNPTGSWIPEDMLKEIVEIAKTVDAYVLCDEVYRGISEDGSYMTSIVDLYDKGISVCSMSKIFSLAGLRMGWIATKDENLLVRLRERRDYDTISCGVLDDIFASLALKNKDKLFDRNRAIMLKNRAILDAWVQKEEHISYVKPVAGTTALLFYDLDIPSRELCIDLLEKTGVFFTPGECFEEEFSVRIGYAYDSKTLLDGLERFSQYLAEKAQ